MKTFYLVLANSLIATVTNTVVWFALTFWIYLTTQSVVATAYLAGTYTIMTLLTGFAFGAIVDHNKKKTAMLVSSVVTLLFFLVGLVVYLITPEISFSNINSAELWILVILLMAGVTVGNIRTIAVPTTVTILVDEDKHDKANGLTGSMMGFSFAITSFVSGVMLAYGGMGVVLSAAVVMTLLSILHLFSISIPEKEIVHLENAPKKIDVMGTIKVMKSIPGLLALTFFSVINNFLGGVFMSLMDAYGLTLVNVQTWGILWGFMSFGFILGGFIVSKRGLGKNPLRALMLANIVMWAAAMLFTVQPWIGLTALGMFTWMTLSPFAEAAEQTVIQKVVPPERQGRVFGFSQSVEQLASPITAFLIGPIAQYIFIPFMTTGRGVDLIGSWYGVGEGRGMGLVFTVAGLIGLVVTLVAMQSRSYHMLSKRYLEG